MKIERRKLIIETFDVHVTDEEFKEIMEMTDHRKVPDAWLDKVNLIDIREVPTTLSFFNNDGRVLGAYQYHTE